jgi:hypothetical protein
MQDSSIPMVWQSGGGGAINIIDRAELRYFRGEGKFSV